MAGIYIHIPFCKKRCTYCDFYTEVTPKLIPEFIDSLIKEIVLRNSYLNNSEINTIYFGGGTPSVLNFYHFQRIFQALNLNFNINKNAEITFEANPDDLSAVFFDFIKLLPFNRISIGIQTFNDRNLIFLNRRHNSTQAIQAIKEAKIAGFTNISIDLIYGLPFQTLTDWTEQLKIAFSLDIQHISAYGLTYEEGTTLWKQRENGELKVVNDGNMIKMYNQLLHFAEKNGFEAYEISNFAKKGYRSQHNSAYWKQEPYLGLGPSAHSYDLKSRQWNISSITGYTQSILKGELFYEREELSLYDRYNDYIMVSLRTIEGIDIHFLEKEFGNDLKNYCLKSIAPFIIENKVIVSANRIFLTSTGILVSNKIIVDLMKV